MYLHKMNVSGGIRGFKGFDAMIDRTMEETDLDRPIAGIIRPSLAPYYKTMSMSCYTMRVMSLTFSSNTSVPTLLTVISNVTRGAFHFQYFY